MGSCASTQPQAQQPQPQSPAIPQTLPSSKPLLAAPPLPTQSLPIALLAPPPALLRLLPPRPVPADANPPTTPKAPADANQPAAAIPPTLASATSKAAEKGPEAKESTAKSADAKSGGIIDAVGIAAGDIAAAMGDAKGDANVGGGCGDVDDRADCMMTGLDIEFKGGDTLESFLMNQMRWVPDCPAPLEQFARESGLAPPGGLTLRLGPANASNPANTTISEGGLCETATQTFLQVVPEWLQSRQNQTVALTVFSADLSGDELLRGTAAVRRCVDVGSILVFERLATQGDVMFDFLRVMQQQLEYRFEWIAKFQTQIAVRCSSRPQTKTKTKS